MGNTDLVQPPVHSRSTEWLCPIGRNVTCNSGNLPGEVWHALQRAVLHLREWEGALPALPASEGQGWGCFISLLINTPECWLQCQALLRKLDKQEHVQPSEAAYVEGTALPTEVKAVSSSCATLQDTSFYCFSNLLTHLDFRPSPNTSVAQTVSVWICVCVYMQCMYIYTYLQCIYVQLQNQSNTLSISFQVWNVNCRLHTGL